MPINSIYLNNENRDIVNLCISILIYFVEFKTQTENKEEFLPLKNFKVHNTTELFGQLVTINGKIYMGLQLTIYYEDKNNPRLKCILLPIEAWTTFGLKLYRRLRRRSRKTKRRRRHHRRQACRGSEPILMV